MKSFAGQYIGNMVTMAFPWVVLLGILLIALLIVAEVMRCLFKRGRRQSAGMSSSSNTTKRHNSAFKNDTPF